MSSSTPSNSVNSKVANVSCPAGKQLVGGGAHIWDAGGSVALDESYPTSASSWRATAYEINATAVNWHVEAFAICAIVAP